MRVWHIDFKVSGDKLRPRDMSKNMLPKRIFWHTNKGKTNTLNTRINCSEHLFFFLNVSLSPFLSKWSPDLFVEKTNCKEAHQFGIFQQNRAIYTNINIMDWTNYHIWPTWNSLTYIRYSKGYSSPTITFPYGEYMSCLSASMISSLTCWLSMNPMAPRLWRWEVVLHELWKKGPERLFIFFMVYRV